MTSILHPLHEHTLILHDGSWYCDACKSPGAASVPRMRCIKCDFDLCSACADAERGRHTHVGVDLPDDWDRMIGHPDFWASSPDPPRRLPLEQPSGWKHHIEIGAAPQPKPVIGAVKPGFPPPKQVGAPRSAAPSGSWRTPKPGFPPPAPNRNFG